jgi:hypothetical protein
MRLAINSKQPFKGRELRVKKAVEPKKREKKALRKEAAADERRAARKTKNAESDDSDDAPKKNFGDIYSSDDSEDEKPNIPKHIIDLSSKQKENNGMVDFAKNSKNDDNGEMKFQNIIAFNQRKRHAMLREMIGTA